MSMLKNLVIISAIQLTINASVSVSYAESSSDLKLTERQKHQIVRLMGFTSMEYIQRLGCETPIAMFIRTGAWEDRWCYENYRQLDFDKIDKFKIAPYKIK